MPVKSILVVDDEDLICEFLTDGLGAYGYHVQATTSVEEALMFFSETHFDLIITDVIMDRGDGFDLLQTLRGKNVPIIVMSGGGRMEAGDYLGIANGLGAYATLQKPFELERLLAIVASIE